MSDPDISKLENYLPVSQAKSEYWRAFFPIGILLFRHKVIVDIAWKAQSGVCVWARMIRNLTPHTRAWWPRESVQKRMQEEFWFRLFFGVSGGTKRAMVHVLRRAWKE